MKSKLLFVSALIFVVGCGPKQEKASLEQQALEQTQTTAAVDLSATASTGAMQQAQGQVVQSIPALSDGTEQIAGEPQLNDPSVSLAAGISSSAPTTKEIQEALQKAGFYQGSVDGVIGPKTKRAIREFQAQNQLKIDGKVGPKTWSRLSSYLSADTTMVATSSIQASDVPASGGY